jgi:hypothetical protein
LKPRRVSDNTFLESRSHYIIRQSNCKVIGPMSTAAFPFCCPSRKLALAPSGSGSEWKSLPADGRTHLEIAAKRSDPHVARWPTIFLGSSHVPGTRQKNFDNSPRKTRKTLTRMGPKTHNCREPVENAGRTTLVRPSKFGRITELWQGDYLRVRRSFFVARAIGGPKEPEKP